MTEENTATLSIEEKYQKSLEDIAVLQKRVEKYKKYKEACEELAEALEIAENTIISLHVRLKCIVNMYRPNHTGRWL